MTRAPEVPRFSRDAEKFLLDKERLEVSARRHWASMVRPGVRGGPVLLAGIWVLAVDPGNRFTTVLGALVALAAAGYLAVAVGEWWIRRFIVTERRVLLVTGVLVRRVAVMPLRRITDMTYQESFVGQLLNYGEFRFESAGKDQALSRISYLPDAKKLYGDISGLLFPDRNGSADDGSGAGGEDEDGGPLPGRAPAVRPPSRSGVGRHPTGPIPGFRSRYPRPR